MLALFLAFLITSGKFCIGCMNNGIPDQKLCEFGGTYTLNRGSEIPVKIPMSSSPPTNCLWIGNRDSRVCTAVLTCDLFNVKFSQNCEENYLEVVDGNVMRVRYCGSSTNLRYEAKGADIFDIKSFFQTPGEFNCKIFCKEDEVVKQANSTTTTTTTTTLSSTTTRTTTTTAVKQNFLADSSGSSKCICGHSKLSGRIVNGKDVDEPGTYPWQGILTVSGRFACGCSLITPLHVLTAAHCTYGRSAATLGFIFGRHNYTNNNTEPSEQKRKAIQVTEHPMLNITKLDYDFSIIKLDSKVLITDYVEPVCLPDNDKNEYGDATQAIATGWGSLQASEMKRPNILQQIKIATWSKNTCGNFKSSQITENMLCAGGEDKDACQGDSGGPLVTLNQKTDLFVLIGVTSWGVGCATPGYPGVYARVTSAMPWIREKINEFNCF